MMSQERLEPPGKKNPSGLRLTTKKYKSEIIKANFYI